MGDRLLAIDTATIACSVALFEGDLLIASDYAAIGRGHAEKLIPAIAQLPDRGKADKILVNCGPGSFTGVRIGISAAKALALAWGAEIHGYSCLALVAAQAQKQLETVREPASGLRGHACGSWRIFFAEFLQQRRTAGAVCLTYPRASSSIDQSRHHCRIRRDGACRDSRHN